VLATTKGIFGRTIAPLLWLLGGSQPVGVWCRGSFYKKTKPNQQKYQSTGGKPDGKHRKSPTKVVEKDRTPKRGDIKTPTNGREGGGREESASQLPRGQTPKGGITAGKPWEPVSPLKKKNGKRRSFKPIKNTPVKKVNPPLPH